MSPESLERIYQDALGAALVGKTREDIAQMLETRGISGDAAEQMFQRAVSERKSLHAVNKADRRTAICASLLVFCVTCLIGTGLGVKGSLAFLCFLSAAALYASFVGTGFFNEIESALICELLLIIALLAIPAIRAARNKAEAGSANASLRRTATDFALCSSAESSPPWLSEVHFVRRCSAPLLLPAVPVKRQVSLRAFS